LRSEQASVLAALCRERGRIFIVNDDVDIALAVGADGVQLGRDDESIAQARTRLGPHKLLGASCYDRLETARAAIAAGADHVAFGSFFASSVKPGAAHASLDLLRAARAELGVPIVAIGGITAQNAQSLIDTGADAIAVITALFTAPDVRAAAAGLQNLFTRSADEPVR
jgi:thiamine-phosphate pyrophosphorylase